MLIDDAFVSFSSNVYWLVVSDSILLMVSVSDSLILSVSVSVSLMLSVSGSLTVKCALAVPLDEAIPITCSPVDNFFIKSGLSVTIILPAFTG